MYKLERDPKCVHSFPISSFYIKPPRGLQVSVWRYNAKDVHVFMVLQYHNTCINMSITMRHGYDIPVHLMIVLWCVDCTDWPLNL